MFDIFIEQSFTESQEIMETNVQRMGQAMVHMKNHIVTMKVSKVYVFIFVTRVSTFKSF